jgi:hypothetical protein
MKYTPSLIAALAILTPVPSQVGELEFESEKNRRATVRFLL